MKTFIGIDYHKKFSYATIMGHDGKILKRGKVSNSLSALGAFFDGVVNGESAAVVEAGYNSLLMYDWLDELVNSVTLANPLKVRAIADAKVKTDKVDSAMLAHLLRCDLIPTAHVSSPRARIGKQLLRYRMFLVGLVGMIKCRIYALLDSAAEHQQQFKGSSIFTKSGITWLRSISLDKHRRVILDSEVSVLEYLCEQIKTIEKALSGFGASDERVAWVDSIPGFGKFLSLLVVSEIDNIKRFGYPAKLHAYAGLVPSSHWTAGKGYNGKLIKAGNKYLRWAMIEAVQPATVKDLTLRRSHESYARRKGSNKARIVTARKLLTIVYHVLEEQRHYKESWQIC